MSETKPYGGDHQAPYDAPGEKRGMGGCAKAFLIIGGLGIAALLVCCVGGWFYMRSAIKTESADVQLVANKVLDWEFNDDLDGKVAAEFFFARFAMFANPDKGFMMIVDSKYADAKDMGRQMDDQFRGQMDSDDDMLEDTTVLEEGSREVTVRGETVQLQFNKTQGTESGKIYWEVLGIVPGKENPTFVMLKVLDDAFPEEEIIRRFENIQ